MGVRVLVDPVHSLLSPWELAAYLFQYVLAQAAWVFNNCLLGARPFCEHLHADGRRWILALKHVEQQPNGRCKLLHIWFYGCPDHLFQKTWRSIRTEAQPSNLELGNHRSSLWYVCSDDQQRRTHRRIRLRSHHWVPASLKRRSQRNRCLALARSCSAANDLGQLWDLNNNNVGPRSAGLHSVSLTSAKHTELYWTESS